MKIALISPNPQHLAQMAQALQDASHEVSTFEGGKSRLPEIVERFQPELALVDGLCLDVCELAAVEQATASDPQLTVVLTCPTHSQDFLLQAMRAGVREILPSPPTSQALLATVERLEAKRRPGKARQGGRVLAFMACKGGSGATFLATNLGSELAETHQVLLLDLNLQFGDALSFVHDGPARTSIADVAREIRRLDTALLASSTVKVSPGYHVLPAPDDLRDAAEVRPEVISALLAVAVTHYDYVVVDLPRDLDGIGIAVLDRAWRIYPVLQAGIPELRHATRLAATFRSLGYPDDRIEFILNRCHRGQDIGVSELRRALGPVKVHQVANDWRDVHAAITTGAPLARSARGSGVARQLHDFAHSIDPRHEAPRSLIDKFFRKA